MKRSCRGIFGLVLAAAIAFPAVAFAQADGGGDQLQPSIADTSATTESVDATAAGTPTLDCNVIALRIMAPEVSGNRFVCRVLGAQPSDTTFTVRAMRTMADQQLPASLRVSSCTGNLAAGVGDCIGGFIDRASSAIGQFSFSATLEPSGATLGPVAEAPTTGTPPVQPKPLLPPAPTAPINYFPLPEP